MNREVIGTGIKKIASGYLFLYIAFHLGSVDILPDWAAYLLMLKGIGMIGEWKESALLLKPLGRILISWEVIEWIGSFLGITIELEVITNFICIMDLYFHFQMLTEISEIGKETGPGYWKKICRLRTVKTLLSTTMVVVTILPMPSIVWNGNDIIWDGILPALAIISLIFCFWICYTLRNLAMELICESDVTVEKVESSSDI